MRRATLASCFVVGLVLAIPIVRYILRVHSRDVFEGGINGNADSERASGASTRRLRYFERGLRRS
jgi:hypothetical protein